MKPRFLSEARRELFDAVTHYEGQASGLGDQFLDEVDHALDFVASYPEAAPLLRGRVRRKGLRKFPYNLLYSREDSTLLIVAVMHQHRRPGYWLGRLS